MGYVPWDDEQRPSSPGFWDILDLLRRRLWLVLGVAAAAIPIAAYLALTTETLHRATAVIRLGDARRALTGGLVEGQGALASRTIDPLRSEVEVISSRATLGAVIDSTPALRIVTDELPLRLFGAAEFAEGALQDTLTLRFESAGILAEGLFGRSAAAYGEPIEAGDATFTILQQPENDRATVILLSRNNAIDHILLDLRVRPREMTNVVDISVVGRDPHRALMIVNRVVEVFQRENAFGAQNQARRQRTFIEAQLAVSDSLLADARRALSRFRAQQTGFQLDGGGSLMQLQVRRDELASERRSLESTQQQLRELDESTRRDVLRAALAMPRLAANVEASKLYTQLVEYETTLDSLQSVSAASNPDVRRTNELIAATEERLVWGLRASIRTLVANLDAEIQTLDTFRARTEATARRFTTAEAEEERLIGQVENARRMTDQLRQAYQTAQLAEAVEVGQVEILDPAVSTRPVGLGALPKVMVVLFLGLVAGAGSAFVVDRSDRAIRTEKQLETLGLPVLGAVPHIKGARRNGAAAREASGPVVEALRGIRLNLVYAHGTAGTLVAAITSPEQGDGKSFVASNLALAFAHAGHTTLLIDGDVRRGGLHRVVDAQRKPGLTDFLLGEATRDEIVQETKFAGLHFIGCGTRTAHAPERLGSADMTQLLNGMRSRFGVILVDTPPLGAGVDALCLGTAAANMMLVVRGGRTNRVLAEAKLDLVERLPIRLLGAVINAARMDSTDRYYSYYMEGYELSTEAPIERLLDQDTSRKLEGGEPEST
jgi:capsular exopolysaccharide synthesis family protein